MRILLFFSLLLFSVDSFAQKAPVLSKLNMRVEKIEWDKTVDNYCSRVLVNVVYENSGEPAVGAKMTLQGRANAIYTIPASGEVEVLTDKTTLSATFNSTDKKSKQMYRSGFANLEIEAGQSYRLYIELKAEQISIPNPPPVARKPVLYFYPEKEMDIDIQLQPFGEFSFTYPKYEKGWSARISPNGNIQIDERNYPYLFWEGKLKGIAPEVRQAGFVIKAEETVAFLEEKLELMGLNEREMTDFITFWAPQLEQNPYNFMHFVRGDDYEDQIAQLQLSQQPDSKIRIHLWYAPLDAPIPVKKQELKSKKRKGFTVVEWGGGAFDWMTP